VIGIFEGRKRRQLELNTRMAVLSFASLAGAALLGVVLVLTGAFAAHSGAFVLLAIFGWLSGLVLAKLYKIVAFPDLARDLRSRDGAARPLAFRISFPRRGHRSGS
jgi:hypothetical protein